MLKRALLSAMVATLIAPAALAASVGVVDFAALQKSPVTQKAMARVNDAQGAYQKELQVRSQKLEEAAKAHKSEAEIAKMRQQYEKELAALRSKGEQDALAAQDAVMKQVDQAVKAVAQDKKLDLVFDKRALIFGGTDITADVEKQLNKDK